MDSGPGSPSDAASFDQGVVRLLISHVSAILWTTDPSLRITWISGGGLAAFGVKPGDGVGKTLFEYFRTEDPRHPPIAAHLGALQGRSGDYEVEFQGRTFYSRVEPFRDEDGTVTGVIGLGLDMTETVRTRKELGESEERFRAVFERSPIGIGILVRGMLRYANPALLGLFRAAQPSDLVGKSVLEHVAPRCRDELRRRLQDREQGRPWSNSFETVGLRADGTEFDYHVDVARIRLPDGEATLAFTSDITERKRAQEDLERRVRERTAELSGLNAQLRSEIAERIRSEEGLKLAQARLIRSEKLASIGMLVAGVAHEINNPLNVIFGNLKLLGEGTLARGKKGKPRRGAKPARSSTAELRKARSMLRDALRAAERARDIVKTFRDFARDTRLAERVDVNDCLRKSAALLRGQIPRSIAIVRHLEPLPRVRCFPGQMSQVFLNLIQNAAEAIEGKGRILLRSRTEDGHVIVQVEDTGKGMAPELRERIFEPFFTTKEVGQGLGLGLAVSAMIVQNHGGEIQVESAPGRGSVFRVRLPLSDSP